jgi:hypothetical protein
MIGAQITNPRPPPRRDHWSRRAPIDTAKRRRGGEAPPVVLLARATNPTSSTDAHEQQIVLDSTSALAYAREHLPCVFRGGEDDGGASGVDGPAPAPAGTTEPLSGGIVNSVFAIRGGSSTNVVLKQALPHVRAVGPSFPLSRARMDAEAAAMGLAERAAARQAGASSSPTARPPTLLHYGRAQSVLISERVPDEFTPMYDALVAGLLPAGPVAAPLFRLLARLQQRPTREEATPDADGRLASSLKNDDMVRANLDVVLRQPFGIMSGDRNEDDAAALAAAIAASPPHLRADAERLLSEPAVRRAARALDDHYKRAAENSSRRSQGLAVAFNDLHPGNVFVATVPAEQGAAALFAAAEGGAASAAAAQQQEQQKPPYLIDWEFAAPGPAEFDVGTLCGNLLAAALALPRVPLPPTPQQQDRQATAVRAAQRAWLLAETAGAWGALQEALKEANDDHQRDDDGDDDDRGDERWAVAWAGAALIRQILGLHRHPLLHLLASATSAEVEATERSCLALGRAMLLAVGEEEEEEPAAAPGAVASFGAAAAVCLELARTLDDLYGEMMCVEDAVLFHGPAAADLKCEE